MALVGSKAEAIASMTEERSSTAQTMDILDLWTNSELSITNLDS